MRTKSVIILLIWVSIIAPIDAQHYVVLKDTTDSNSIVRKVQQIETLEVRPGLFSSTIRSGSGGIQLDLQSLRQLPAILGESDPYKALQYTGGISQAGEASAAMNVRGGNSDQNSILYNGCLLQNPTHMLGLFSVFNAELIDFMRYIKWGIPAEYGGRLSSVVDIRNVTYMPDKTSVDGSVGLIASRLSLKTPLSDEFGIYAGLRKSYISAFVLPIMNRFVYEKEMNSNNFEFYDINAGFTWQLNSKNKLSAHYYQGQDKLQIAENEKFSINDNRSDWGNRAFSIDLWQSISDEMSWQHSMHYSGFGLQSQVNWATDLYQLKATNNVFNYRSVANYREKNHSFKTGIDADYVLTNPTQIFKPDSVSGTGFTLPTTTVSVFASDEWQRGPFLLNAGIRTGIHADLSHNDTISFSERVSVGIEPRILVRIMTGENASVKAAITRNYQYFSRVQIVNIGIPFELHVPASVGIKPSASWQYAAGYYKQFKKAGLETSAELYYKNYDNLLEYAGNFNQLISGKNLLNQLYSGKGWSYGFELMFKKTSGHFSAWLNYALSWSYRQFNGINQGKPYLATNDRRHDLTAVGIYSVNKNLRLSAAFAFATGSRLNLPRSWYIIDNKVILEYGSYNDFAMPDYHRLDISVNYALPSRTKLKSEFNLTIYNLYNRSNPFQVYFSTKNNTANMSEYQIKMSYLTPVLPTLSWIFHY